MMRPNNRPVSGDMPSLADQLAEAERAIVVGSVATDATQLHPPATPAGAFPPPPPVAVATVILDPDAESFERIERIGAALREVGLRIQAAGRVGRSAEHREKARLALAREVLRATRWLGDIARVLDD